MLIGKVPRPNLLLCHNVKQHEVMAQLKSIGNLNYGGNFNEMDLRFFVCLVLAPFAAAQNAPTVKQAESACGSFDVKFDVKTEARQHPLAPAEADKAQIYVIEDWDWRDRGRINRPTVHVGMDGK